MFISSLIPYHWDLLCIAIRIFVCSPRPISNIIRFQSSPMRRRYQQIRRRRHISRSKEFNEHVSIVCECIQCYYFKIGTVDGRIDRGCNGNDLVAFTVRVGTCWIERLGCIDCRACEKTSWELHFWTDMLPMTGRIIYIIVCEKDGDMFMTTTFQFQLAPKI